ncbi:MAG: hypothetical protein PHY09_11025 [Desulfuromonadaceae bacterium]|nr:hypothetical protein [Desulfuromonadaceae bacterium]MDD5104605.1 hypothetical protein [Desulfuromonadaceae bacterium]
MLPLAHISAGVTLGFRHRLALKHLLASTTRDSTLLTLDPVKLHASGISALALDFDGVLANHGNTMPLPEAIAWLQRCEATFGGDSIFILSNKPTTERREWFAEHFPSVQFISGVRKKPYPDGLKKTGELAGVPLSSILMVDDRLLTGCLAALIAGAGPCYIRSPYVSYATRPVAELFLGLLRRAERLYVRVITLV